MAVQAVLLSLMLVLAGRLWYLQAVASDAYAAAADDNAVREIVSPAPRGLILDQMGRPLARNRSHLEVAVDRQTLTRQPDDGAVVLGRLAEILDTDAADLQARITPCGPGVPEPCWNGSRYRPVPVASDVDPQTALAVKERRELFPGVTVDQVTVRDYPAPYGVNAAHVLGYVAPADEAEMTAQREAGRIDPRLAQADLVGRAGLEKQYDQLLRGRPEVGRVSVDHQGRVLAPGGETPAQPGHDLVTTIDARVQGLAERELAAAVERARSQPDYRGRTYEADSGAIVVLDVHTGGIVAMASYPTYDPAVWVGGIEPAEYRKLTSEKAGVPLLSRAHAAGAAPGSTFKVVSTAAAASAGYSFEDLYSCPSSYTVAGRTFRNYESEAYGDITLKRALEVSCDTVFYKIAHEMWLKDGGIRPVDDPADPMQEMAREFGLGRPTGVDLPNEAAGRVADREYKREYWERTREATCARAEAGYDELRESDPARADFLEQLDRENCVDGHAYRAGDAVNFAIGQGDTLVTPLQLARMYAAIANGGTLWRPYLAKAEIGPDGEEVRSFDPVAEDTLDLPEEVLDYLQEALAGVSSDGTAAAVYREWPLKEVPVATKTGTAEKFGEDPSSWFAGYAPAGEDGSEQEPRYAVVMTVSQGGTGSGTSGPAVRELNAAMLGVGREAVLPDGRLPEGLPAARPDGTYEEPE